MVCNCPFVAFIFSSNAFAVVVTGEEFNGISTRLVIPPAIAALVAVLNPPSQSSHFIDVYMRINHSAISTLSPASITGKSPLIISFNICNDPVFN
jgi:hypothetical protein